MPRLPNLMMLLPFTWLNTPKQFKSLFELLLSNLRSLSQVVVVDHDFLLWGTFLFLLRHRVSRLYDIDDLLCALFRALPHLFDHHVGHHLAILVMPRERLKTGPIYLRHFWLLRILSLQLSLACSVCWRLTVLFVAHIDYLLDSKTIIIYNHTTSLNLFMG